MSETVENISVHRHRDRVAVTFDGQPTVYLNSHDVGWLTAKLTECANDIVTRPASQSAFKTARLG